MIFRPLVSIFLFSLLACHQALSISPVPPQQTQQEKRGHLLTSCEKVLLQQLDQLKAIAQYLTQIAKKPEQKNIRLWLMQRMNKISDIQSKPRNPINEEKLTDLVHATTLLTDQLLALLENNLEKVPEAFPSKGFATTLSLADIQQHIDDNEDIVETIKDKARSAGLTRWNATFRFLEMFVPSPTTALVTIGLVAGALTLSSSLRQKVFGQAQPHIEINTIHLYPAPAAQQPDNLNRAGRYALTAVGLFNAWAMYSKMAETFPQSTQKDIKNATENFWQKLQKWWERAKGNDATFISSTYEMIDTITLDDPRLIGIDDQKKVLWSAVNYLLDPELFIRQGAKIEKGILLVGPSRCGKTLAAKALSGTVNKLFEQRGITSRVVFREIRHHELWEGNLKNIIEEAKRMAPCILFIDEIHALDYQIQNRSTTRLAEALTALNDLGLSNDPRHQVFVVAATNRPDLLDSAFINQGRFGEIVHFKLPTFATRKQFFETNLKAIAANPKDFDLDALAHKTEFRSYGDLQKVFDKARLATNNIESIKQHHFLKAIDQSIRNIIDTVPIEPHTKRLVAAYQAGRALAYMLLQPEERLDTVTIWGINKKIVEINEWTESKSNDRKIRQHDIVYGGIFTYHDDENMPASNEQELRKLMSICLAGKIAEDLLLGTHSLNYNGNNRAEAFDLAKAVRLDGLTEKDLSQQAIQKMYDEALALVAKVETSTRQLLQKNKDHLAKIAATLEERYTLSVEELQKLMAPAA